jgi:hypothetical protein
VGSPLNIKISSYNLGSTVVCGIVVELEVGATVIGTVVTTIVVCVKIDVVEIGTVVTGTVVTDVWESTETVVMSVSGEVVDSLMALVVVDVVVDVPVGKKLQPKSTPTNKNRSSDNTPIFFIVRSY